MDDKLWDALVNESRRRAEDHEQRWAVLGQPSRIGGTWWCLAPADQKDRLKREWGRKK